MNLTRKFVENFAHPSGWLGRVVAWRLDISNQEANEWTLSVLNIKPFDRVLEVGFGSGRTLKIAAGKLIEGSISGVDSSRSMLKIAQRTNAWHLNHARMELKLGEVENLSYPDNHFDKVYSVQVINYLPEPLVGLQEIHRVTKPGGRMALFFEAKEKFDRLHGLIDGIYRPYSGDEVLAMIREAGFSHAWVETKVFLSRSFSYRGYIALGEKSITA